MKIFIVNGQGGCGKTTFEETVQAYAQHTYHKDTSILSIITPIKTIAKRIGWDGKKDDKDRAFLHDLKVLLHNYNNYDYDYIKRYVQYARELRRDIVFIDMREYEDIAWFKSLFPETKTILVTKGEAKTYGNYADDSVYDNRINYDYEINNNGTLEELREKAIKFYEEVKEK